MSFLLISYAWRRYGSGDWHLANCVKENTTPAEWLLKTKSYEGEEYVFISATPITEEEYKKLYEKL